MLERVLEPEVMDSFAEAICYDAMDHTEVNRAFARDFLHAATNLWPNRFDLRVLDVGTGTALIPCEICRQNSDLRIVAVDLSKEMLAVATTNLTKAGLNDRIFLQVCDGKQLGFDDETFAAVISNSLLHHVAEPRLTLTEMWRVLQSEGLLFLRDLFRPESNDEVERLVKKHASTGTPEQQQLLRQSLHAALTLDEVATVCQSLSIPTVGLQQTSDRHWTLVARKPPPILVKQNT